MNSAQIATDKQLAKMEKELERIYRKSAKDIAKKWDAYMQEASQTLASYQSAYQNALKHGTVEEIKKARIALQEAQKDITIYNQYYQDMLQATTYQLATVNQTALAYVNDQMPNIYAINYNYGQIEAASVEMQFNIVDYDTVKNLVKQGDITLPNKALNIPKDMRWNTKQLNSSVLQGILQGESMDDIAKRILPIVDNNQAAAIRNARTMVTGAQNLGAQDRMERLEEDGALIKKVWMATPDERTREWHLDMDGEEVDLHESFIDGLGNRIAYPGDPEAAPETVYNCRCTMISHIIGVRRSDGSVRYLSEPDEKTLHEKQMAEERKERGR